MVLVNTAVHGLLLATAGAAFAADAAYIRQIEQDRRETDEFLRSERSPLRLVGRFRVKEGRSTLGSDPASAIGLPSRAPLHAGTIDRQGNQFYFEAAPGIAVGLNGKSALGTLKLQVAASPKPSDRVSFGDFTFAIRPIGGEFDLLLNDAQSPFLKEFTGTTWFPVDAAYRVEAQFQPYENSKTVMVPLTGGTAAPYTVSGEVVFQLAGRKLRLQALAAADGKSLFIMFRDQTSGRETYGGGRFLDAETPRGGKTTLDFNKAYNPYCAYDPYAVCPIPPKENRLAVPIRAGETSHNGSAQAH